MNKIILMIALCCSINFVNAKVNTTHETKLKQQAHKHALETTQKIFEVMKSGATYDYIGEKVTQLEHALQAGQNAINNKCDDEIIIASLLHDIGHLCAPAGAKNMNGLGIADHEHIGADFLLQHGFSKRVSEVVRGHAQAKRYLCRDHNYYKKVSPASQKTLIHQGGIMNKKEADDFEKDPLIKEKILLRNFEEASKQAGWKVQDLSTYKAMIVKHLEQEFIKRAQINAPSKPEQDLKVTPCAQDKNQKISQ